MKKILAVALFLLAFAAAAYAAGANPIEREFVFFIDNVENRPAGSFEVGDIVLEVNGVSLEGFTDLKKLGEKMFKVLESDDISAVVLRNGKKTTVSEKNFTDQNKSISYNILKKKPSIHR